MAEGAEVVEEEEEENGTDHVHVGLKTLALEAKTMAPSLAFDGADDDGS